MALADLFVGPVWFSETSRAVIIVYDRHTLIASDFERNGGARQDRLCLTSLLSVSNQQTISFILAVGFILTADGPLTKTNFNNVKLVCSFAWGNLTHSPPLIIHYS